MPLAHRPDGREPEPHTPTAASGSLPTPQWARVRPLLGFALVLAFGAYLRFHELSEPSVWLDEAITWERATLPLPALLEDTIRRNHNPSYFLLMHAWLQLGDDELMMRLPSVFMGVLRLAAACALGAIAGGTRVGILTCLLLALMPEQLRYDQEARMYAQLGLFTTVALCGLMWLLRHPEARALWPIGPRPRAGVAARLAWLAVVLGTAGALYSHNVAVFFPVATSAAALCGLVAQPNHRGAFARTWLVAQACVLLLWSPWLRFLLRQTRQVHERFWATFPRADQIVDILAELYAFRADEPVMIWLCAGLFVAALWSLRRDRWLALALLLLAWLTPALLLLVSLERPMFMTRVMLWTGAPWALLLAFAARSLGRWQAFVALCVVVTGLGLYNLNQHYFGQRRKPDWKAALTVITTTRAPDALALMSGGRDRRQVHYYLGRRVRPYPAFDHVDVARAGMVEQLPALVAGRSEVWVIHRGKKGNTRRVVAALRRWGRQTFRRHYGHSLHIRRFEMRGTP